MRTYSANQTSWIQFDQFVRTGVPHAVDIAKVLADSSLVVPISPSFDLSDADLLYYGPVHSANRQKVLSRFLFVLEKLRFHPSWDVLRNCCSAQLTLIETLSQTSLPNDNECVELLASWMKIHSSTSTPETYVLNTEFAIKRAA